MWPNPQFPVDLVTFTEDILNGKLHVLGSVTVNLSVKYMGLPIRFRASCHAT